MSPRFYHDSRRSFSYVTPELVEKVKGAIRKE